MDNNAKIEILNNLINNSESSKYWSEQEMAAESATSSPDQGVVDSLDIQINRLKEKIAYFEAEKAKLA